MVIYENMIDDLNFNYELDSMNALFESYLVEFKLDIKGLIDKVISFFKETVPKYIKIIKTKIEDFVYKLKKEDIKDRTKRIVKEISRGIRVVEVDAKDIDLNEDAFKELDKITKDASYNFYKHIESSKPSDFVVNDYSRYSASKVETKLQNVIDKIKRYSSFEVLSVSGYVYFPEPKSGKLKITNNTIDNIFGRNAWNSDLGILSDDLNRMEKVRQYAIKQANGIKKTIGANDVDRGLISRYISEVMSATTNIIKMLNTQISVQISIINYFHDLIIKIENKLNINLPANREDLYNQE